MTSLHVDTHSWAKETWHRKPHDLLPTTQVVLTVEGHRGMPCSWQHSMELLVSSVSVCMI